MPEQGSRRAGRTMVTAVAVYGLAYSQLGMAEPLISNNYNLYGVPGLIEMPTAENAPDAELAGSYAGAGTHRRTTLSFQIAPRVNGSFRYSKIPDFAAGGADLYDRSFDLRFQFLDEGKWVPAVAVGLQDFLGTGVYAGEYLVATKTIWDKVRVTAGLGWGRLGTGNEITSTGTRDPKNADTGGQLNFDDWFKGPVSPFGGVSWAATDKLTFKAEYSSDDYARETARGLDYDYDTPWNFGVDYRVNDGIALSASYLYGSKLGFQVSFIMNPKKPLLGPGNEPGPLPVRPRPSRAADPEAWSQSWTTDTADLQGIETGITKALAKEGIRLDAILLQGTRAEVRIENNRYFAESEAIGRTARILTRALPPSVETFTITPVLDGVPNARVSFSRTDLEQLENADVEKILARTTFSEAPFGMPLGMNFADPSYPMFTWYAGTYLGFGFFDPDEPVRADFGLKLGASYTLMPGLVLSGSVRQRLAGNVADAPEERSNPTLPVVRTDFREYAKKSPFFLSSLDLAYYGKPAPDVYSRVTVGVLERMYSGISGELLWMPVESRLALGAEVNYLGKRDYYGGFGLQDYRVTTGHLSAYYSFEQGYQVQVDAGRYLAGDWGGTLSFDRYFDNGWRIGAFATLTNVPAEDFGEGSFDKGIYFEVPLRWATGQPSQSTSSMVIRSLTKDAGQRVRVGGRLYERVRPYHRPVIEGSAGRFWR